MKKLLKITTTVLVFLCSSTLFSQNLTQTIKGSVSDKAIKSPLIGANITILNTNPLQGATVDNEGHFKIERVPIGKYTLKVSFIGYKDVFINNVAVNSGKELDLAIDMEENVIQGEEVVIKAKIEKQKALNELSAVSTRAFSVEETQRFAAAFNDPGRMATAYAGVISAGDGNNTIVIRGNSPNGLLWRMEGVDIPNPNHFSSVGSSGGGISILSAQLLTNSDFSTGAFAAEYGNALSGVFDLKLRKGNREKREYTIQAGILGLDLAAEGPLSTRNKNGSYLVNYRYSTLSLLSKLGLNIGDAPTNFQDLSFNIALPTEKYGNFTLFGFGGLSSQNAAGVADSLKWKDDSFKKYGFGFNANTGAMGLTHSLVFKKSYLKTIISTSGTDNNQNSNEILKDYSHRLINDQKLTQTKYTISSVYNHKFNAQHLLRTGGYMNFIQYGFLQKNWNNESKKLVAQINSKGNTMTTNAFAQWQYRPTEDLTFNTGIHTFYLDLNKKATIEPRFSAKYAFSEHQSLSFGYGLHSQMQPLGVYFYETKKENTETLYKPNANLDFTKAHHFVLSFDQSFSGNWHIKTEAYYQGLYGVPLSKGNKNTLSLLNLTDGFTAEIFENKGKGQNYGLELTVEKFLTNGFYMLLSSSLYESKYQALDGKWYNTLFNSNIANSFLMGKEWDLKRKNRTFSFNMKLTHTGGIRDTPIKLEESKVQNETVYDFTKAFANKSPYYLRADVGVHLRRNYNRMTTTLALDIQNVTNRQNVFNQYFDTETQSLKTNYQAPIIPILSYKIEF